MAIVLDDETRELKNRRMHFTDAYFTIEASLLMPMVFFVVLFLFYAGIFQYDRCLTEQGAKQLLLRASNQKLSEEDLYFLSREKFEHPFMTRDFIEIKTNQDEAQLSFYGGIKTILEGLNNRLGMEFFEIRITHRTEIFKPVEFIRGVRKVEKYVENGFCE